jgi:hypothetical protein
VKQASISGVFTFGFEELIMGIKEETEKSGTLHRHNLVEWKDSYQDTLQGSFSSFLFLLVFNSFSARSKIFYTLISLTKMATGREVFRKLSWIEPV